MNTDLLYAIFPPEIYFLHHGLATSLGSTISTPVSSPRIYFIYHGLATSSGFTRSTYSAGPKRALQTGQQICIFRSKCFPKKCSHKQLGQRMCPQGSLQGFSSRLSSFLVERYSSMHILHSLSSLVRSMTSTDVEGWRTFTTYASCKISSSRRSISACSMQQCSCMRRPRGPCSSFSRPSLRMTLFVIFSSPLRQSRSAWAILPWNGSSAPSGIVIEKQFVLASLSALVTLSQMWCLRAQGHRLTMVCCAGGTS
jgi:hypothetical protein